MTRSVAGLGAFVVVVVVGIVVIVGGRGGDRLKEGVDFWLVIDEIVVAGLLGLVFVVDQLRALIAFVSESHN